MAPNFCEHCGAKVHPEQKFCQDCGVSLTTAPTNIVTQDGVQLPTAPSSSAQPRAHTNVLILGLIGGVLGGVIGTIFLVGGLWVAQDYAGYTGYYSNYYASQILLIILVGLGILAFSIIGALGGAQKLDARSKVNAGGLFLAGIAVLLLMAGFGVATARTDTLTGTLVFVLIALVICLLFCLGGYLLLRKPTS